MCFSKFVLMSSLIFCDSSNSLSFIFSCELLFISGNNSRIISFIFSIKAVVVLSKLCPKLFSCFVIIKSPLFSINPLSLSDKLLFSINFTSSIKLFLLSISFLLISPRPLSIFPFRCSNSVCNLSNLFFCSLISNKYILVISLVLSLCIFDIAFSNISIKDKFTSSKFIQG